MNNYFFLGLLGHLLIIQAKKVPCPADGKEACIKCTCDTSSGYNSCVPAQCPRSIKKVSEVKMRRGIGVCPHGEKFTAACSLCRCTGQSDHCAICFALPIRRISQSKEVNKKLPWLQDNRIFNYEVNGWSSSESKDEDWD